MSESLKLRSIYKNGFLFDYTKQKISDEHLKNLFDKCDAQNLKSQIKDLFDGKKINKTEDRAVLHTALRDFKRYNNTKIDHEFVGPLVQKSLDKIDNFVSKLYANKIKGYSGKPITDIINIGIGGSDLGPWMTTTALRTFNKGIKVHYVSKR